jgi:hypothetical protein
MPLVGYLVAVLTLGEQMALGKTIIVSLIVVALYVFTKFETKQEEQTTERLPSNKKATPEAS